MGFYRNEHSIYVVSVVISGVFPFNLLLFLCVSHSIEKSRLCHFLQTKLLTGRTVLFCLDCVAISYYRLFLVVEKL